MRFSGRERQYHLIGGQAIVAGTIGVQAGRRRLATSVWQPAASVRPLVLEALYPGRHVLSAQACEAAISYCTSRLDWLVRVASETELGKGMATVDADESVRVRRIAADLVGLCCDGLERFALRLSADAHLLEYLFGRPLGVATRMEPGLSDPHDGGQAVIYLEFASGVAVYYKPRPVIFLSIWNTLLMRIARPRVGDMLAPRVLDRGDHGWVEAVTSRCPDDQRKTGHCMKAGAMLCLAYVLGSSDLHTENVIDHILAPVLIDAETLLWSGVERMPSVDMARSAAFDLLFRDSVVRTGLVPRWQAESRASYTSAGLSIYGDLFKHGRRSFERQLLEGFTAVYDSLSSRAVLDEIIDLLEACDEGDVRVLLRPTRVYQRLIELGVRAYVSGGSEAQARVLQQALGRAAGAFGGAAAAVVKLEAEAISRCDVPRFTHERLRRAGMGFEERTGLAYVRDRLSSCGGDDLQRQRMLTQASFALLHGG